MKRSALSQQRGRDDAELDEAIENDAAAELQRAARDARHVHELNHVHEQERHSNTEAEEEASRDARAPGQVLDAAGPAHVPVP